MNVLKLLLMLTLLFTVACSKKKVQEVGEEDLSESVVMEDEINDELDELEGIEIADSQSTEEVMEEINNEVENSDGEEIVISDDSEYIIESSEPVALTNDMGSYTVKGGDTLMWIAFKLYGDYRKWKSIVSANPILKRSGLKKGMNLNYNMPEVAFQWNPKGSPYLIVDGDNLGIVSDKVYGTKKQWKYIWDNNRAMIRNPNLIFAGFTLYYLPLRDVASVKK